MGKAGIWGSYLGGFWKLSDLFRVSCWRMSLKEGSREGDQRETRGLFLPCFLPLSSWPGTLPEFVGVTVSVRLCSSNKQTPNPVGKAIKRCSLLVLHAPHALCWNSGFWGLHFFPGAFILTWASTIAVVGRECGNLCTAP